MQRSHPNVRLLAVNAANHASGLGAMADEGDIPLLQDHASVDAWGLWEVTYRDVVILGRDNERVGVFNLTDHDLADAESFAELERMLEDAVTAP